VGDLTMTRYIPLFAAVLIASPALAGPDRPLKPGTVITKAINLTSYRYIDALTEANGLRMDGFNLRYGRAGIRLRGDARDIVIRNGTMTTKGITKGSDLPVGIDIGGTVHDVLIEGVTATGHRMVYVPKKYTNGDGFSQEAQVYRVTYRRDVSTDNSDGGFDLKGQARLEDLVAERNGRNYRFWNDITATTLTSRNPSGAHVWLNAKAAQTVVIDRLVVSSNTTAPVLRIENPYPVSIVVKECVIAVPAGTLLQWSGKAARVTWGKNCTRDAKGYAVNTPVTAAAPQGIDAGEVLVDRDDDGLVKLRATWAKKLKVPTGTTVRLIGGTWYEIGIPGKARAEGR
jgi:hypothetical protein